MRSALERVGNTPLVKLNMDTPQNVTVLVKLESSNPTGSVKDRAAYYILRNLLDSGTIDKHTTIIESTSGNFGVALSAFCKHFGLRFIAVVDPNITAINEMLIDSMGAEMVKVDKPDINGGYLLSRIEMVKKLVKKIENNYWVNQYENPLNAAAYYDSLGLELCQEIKNIDYVFLGVSSGGTITGVSQKVKASFPKARIIAVDVEGSVIFGHPPKKRNIPGIGSSMVPAILQNAALDDVVITNEISTIEACHLLLKEHGIFAGGSSGSVFAGISKFFELYPAKDPVTAVTIFPDRGERYFDTIYNEQWCNKVRRAGRTHVTETL